MKDRVLPDGEPGPSAYPVPNNKDRTEAEKRRMNTSYVKRTS